MKETPPVFITLSETKNDVRHLLKDPPCRAVHEIQRALVIRLYERMHVGEPVEGPAVYPDDEVGRGEEGVCAFKRAYVFEARVCHVGVGVGGEMEMEMDRDRTGTG